MHIAIEGCAHGELDVIYNAVKELQRVNKFKVELLICCGDFQAVRNKSDLKCMAVPQKYMQMQDFHEYYSGKKVAPILTLFIGGNHEASNHMQELPYGGWVAPNIYYMGYASIVKVGSLRIGGLSGIYKGSDYLKGHHEKPPYDDSSVRSVYHVRNLEAFRLKQVAGNVDIFLSHDWPRGIYHHGNKKKLISTKKYFKSDIDDNTLGSRPAEDLLRKLKPKFWFSGHLHIKFAAILHHQQEEGETDTKQTKFLALDKCLPRREFLQILDITSDDKSGNVELQYDEEWLTILRLTDHLLSTENRISYMPGPGYTGRYDFTPTAEEIEETKTLFGSMVISPSDFKINAELDPATDCDLNLRYVSMPEPKRNPQTEKFCNLLGVTDPMAVLCGWKPSNPASFAESSVNFNDSEMNVTLNSSAMLDEGSFYLNSTGDCSAESHDIFFALDESGPSSTSGSPIKLLDITPKSSRLNQSSSEAADHVVETNNEEGQANLDEATVPTPKLEEGTVTAPKLDAATVASPNSAGETITTPKLLRRKIVRRNAEQYAEE